MSSFWELNVIEGKNPVHTGQFLNSYDQREFTQEEVVAREGAQNAMDAGRKLKGVTEIEFRSLQISGENKTRLIELLQLKELLGPRLASFEQNPRQAHFVSNARKALHDEQLTALLIRDKKTCGLGGAFNKYEKEDHFARLVCALNLDDKADGETNSGGSFGLGKTAYAKSSLINTVLYHSTFEPTERSNFANRRLMVSGIYPRHSHDGKDYGGFAYFGKKDPANPKQAIPFENEDAKDFWQKITSLFNIDTMRSDNEHGTDILIFMSSVDIEQIKTATEDYYFPALIDGQVSIKFYDQDGQPSFPNPLGRKDLDQFVNLMKDAKKGAEENRERKEVATFQRFNGLKLGKFAFELAETDEASSPKNNCVAIMRGTGMIINYLKLGSEQYEPAVGAFFADEEIWKFLTSSENAAHSEWNEKSSRLQQDFPDFGKDLVSSLNSRLRNRFSNFQKNLQPDITHSRSDSGFLARLLSGALSGSSGDGPVPKGEANPVSLSLTKSTRDMLLSRWRLLITSNEHTPENPFKLKIIPSISIAGDAKMVPIKHMDFSISDKDGLLLERGTNPMLEFQFQTGSVLDLIITFDDPGRLNYIVNCKCMVPKEFSNVDV